MVPVQLQVRSAPTRRGPASTTWSPSGLRAARNAKGAGWTRRLPVAASTERCNGQCRPTRFGASRCELAAPHIAHPLGSTWRSRRDRRPGLRRVVRTLRGAWTGGNRGHCGPGPHTGRGGPLSGCGGAVGAGRQWHDTAPWCARRPVVGSSGCSCAHARPRHARDPGSSRHRGATSVDAAGTPRGTTWRDETHRNWRALRRIAQRPQRIRSCGRGLGARALVPVSRVCRWHRATRGAALGSRSTGALGLTNVVGRRLGGRSPGTVRSACSTR